MANLEYILERAVHVFPILNRSLQETNCTNGDITFVFNELIRLGIAEKIYNSVIDNINYLLHHQIVPKFWKYFNVDNDTENGFYQFQLSIYELHQEYNKFHSILQRLKILKSMCEFENKQNQQQDDLNEFSNMLKKAMLEHPPPNFDKIVSSFYHISFKVFANSHQDNDDELMDEVKCNGCNKETDNCRCQELVCAFNKTNQYLSDMNLLDRLAGYTLTNLIQERINTHVQDTCKGIFDMSHIDNLLQWLDTIVLNWLTRINNQGSLKIEPQNTKIKEVLKDFRIKLEYYLYETYAHIIIDQFFNIIIDFPDSRPAIDDLKICLSKLDLRVYLINSIKQSLEKRLLHPGVNTTDILTGYVAAIKAIRHLDSTGVLLETITEPVKQYMRSRQDTVRCVASALTDDGPTDLAEELARSEAYTENGNNDNWQNWMPDPIDANPKQQYPVSRSADIISMVVDIYGSKEIFVKEYRSLLADRLLTQLDFSPEKEIRNLELLKLRFDETLLHTCEVMLKDISDSKRINAHIQNDSEMESDEVVEKPFELSSLILSSQFWPAFRNDTLELPPDLKSVFDKYTKLYEAYKGNRTLCWRPYIGRVELDIEIGDKVLNLTVSPIHAIVIYEFQAQKSWHLEYLSQKIQVPPSVVRKRLAFWQAQGLIKETATDHFTLIEEFQHATGEQSGLQTHPHHHDVEDDEAESAMASVSDQREEELQVFWSYIVGMLTNLDSLPLERIHQMLKMFASHGPGVEFSQEELKNFLQHKVREHALVFAAGVYQLPK